MIKPTEAQRKQWGKEGYLVFENAIEGDELRRLQEAFDYWAEKCKPEWLDRIEAGEATATLTLGSAIGSNIVIATHGELPPIEFEALAVGEESLIR